MYSGSVVDGWLYFGGLFFDPTVTDAGLVPTVYFLFDASFATISAIIISGLVAGRIKFGAYLLFTFIYTTFIYPIACSWKWNGGWLDSLGFVDYAGSSIVLSTGAWAGLAGSMILGPRHTNFENGLIKSLPPNNVSQSILGALIMLVGWLGFNASSQFTMDQWVPYIANITLLAASAGALGAAIISTLLYGKINPIHIMQGMLAGLASITAGCSYMTLAGAWFSGFFGGIISMFSIKAVKSVGIDDPLGLFSIFGTCGIWGTIVIGLWGTAVQGDGAGMGLFNGGGITILLVQSLGAAAYAFWTLITSWIAWSIIGGLFGGLRVSKEAELLGLDIAENGLKAYNIYNQINK